MKTFHLLEEKVRVASAADMCDYMKALAACAIASSCCCAWRRLRIGRDQTTTFAIWLYAEKLFRAATKYLQWLLSLTMLSCDVRRRSGLHLTQIWRWVLRESCGMTIYVLMTLLCLFWPFYTVVVAKRRCSESFKQRYCSGCGDFSVSKHAVISDLRILENLGIGSQRHEVPMGLWWSFSWLAIVPCTKSISVFNFHQIWFICLLKS